MIVGDMVSLADVDFIDRSRENANKPTLRCTSIPVTPSIQFGGSPLYHNPESGDHPIDPASATVSAAADDLRFHHRHGRNAHISHDGRTASRPNARGEFNDAIVMSSRPLRDNELFDVKIDKMVDRWSGSIEAGQWSD